VKTTTTTTGARVRDAMLVRALAAALVLMALAATTLIGQNAPQRLTLEDAIRLARDYNPTYLSTRNDRPAADWQAREAYSAFLPTVNFNGQAGWAEGGQQRFGTVDLGVAGTDWYQSYYSLSANWTLDGNAIFGVPAARANQKAVDARIAAAEFNLGSQVTLQYMAVLRARDGVDVAQRQLDRAQQNRRIVETRVSSGAAAGTDGRQAEIDLGRAEVALIQARRAYREGLALLAEQLGVALEDDTQLSSEFEVFEPTWSRDELMDIALNSHPSLRAFRAQASAASAQAKQAGSAYFPSFTLSTALQGTTQEATNRDFIVGGVEDDFASRFQSCQFNNALLAGVPTLPGSPRDCSSYLNPAPEIQRQLADNAAFPFDFTKRPLQVTLSVSVPVFTGFSRQRQLSEANNRAEDAKYNLKAEELRLRTSVTQAYDNLGASYEAVQIEDRGRSLADEQLAMQQRRYALGAAGLLELLDAQTTATTADQTYLNALYDFHWNLIRLEAAVGQPLRPGRGPLNDDSGL
jgi:outer membrane protein TolC